MQDYKPADSESNLSRETGPDIDVVRINPPRNVFFLDTYIKSIELSMESGATSLASILDEMYAVLYDVTEERLKILDDPSIIYMLLQLFPVNDICLRTSILILDKIIEIFPHHASILLDEANIAQWHQILASQDVYVAQSCRQLVATLSVQSPKTCLQYFDNFIPYSRALDPSDVKYMTAIQELIPEIIDDHVDALWIFITYNIGDYTDTSVQSGKFEILAWLLSHHVQPIIDLYINNQSFHMNQVLHLLFSELEMDVSAGYNVLNSALFVFPIEIIMDPHFIILERVQTNLQAARPDLARDILTFLSHLLERAPDYIPKFFGPEPLFDDIMHVMFDTQFSTSEAACILMSRIIQLTTEELFTQLPIIDIANKLISVLDVNRVEFTSFLLNCIIFIIKKLPLNVIKESIDPEPLQALDGESETIDAQLAEILPVFEEE